MMKSIMKAGLIGAGAAAGIAFTAILLTTSSAWIADNLTESEAELLFAGLAVLLGFSSGVLIKLALREESKR